MCDLIRIPQKTKPEAKVYVLMLNPECKLVQSANHFEADRFKKRRT